MKTNVREPATRNSRFRGQVVADKKERWDATPGKLRKPKLISDMPVVEPPLKNDSAAKTPEQSSKFRWWSFASAVIVLTAVVVFRKSLVASLAWAGGAVFLGILLIVCVMGFCLCGVWALNFRRNRMMDTSGLPPNVTVVPLSNWEEAEKQMKQTLAVQIQQELKTEPVSVSNTEQEIPSPEIEKSRSSVMIWTTIFGLIAAGAIGWFWIRRRKRSTNTAEEINESEPQNLLRPEELLRQTNEISSGLVAVVEFYNGKNSRSEILLRDDRRIVGKSTTADIIFSSLKQENSLEIKFDGKHVSAFRLHPQTYYEVDEVWLNQAKAPLNQTIFHLQNADLLKIGDIQISAKIVESSVAQIIHEKKNRAATQSFRPANKSEPSNIADPLNRSNERKSRWN